MDKIQPFGLTGLCFLVLGVFIQAMFYASSSIPPSVGKEVYRIGVRERWRRLQRGVLILAITCSSSLLILSLLSGLITEAESLRIQRSALTVSIWTAGIAVALWPFDRTLDVVADEKGIYVRSILIPWNDVRAVQDDGQSVWIHCARQLWNAWWGRTALPRYVWDIDDRTAGELEYLRARFIQSP